MIKKSNQKENISPNLQTPLARSPAKKIYLAHTTVQGSRIYRAMVSHKLVQIGTSTYCFLLHPHYSLAAPASYVVVLTHNLINSRYVLARMEMDMN